MFLTTANFSSGFDFSFVIAISIALILSILVYHTINQLKALYAKKRREKRFADRRVPFIEELGLHNEIRTRKK